MPSLTYTEAHHPGSARFSYKLVLAKRHIRCYTWKLAAPFTPFAFFASAPAIPAWEERATAVLNGPRGE